MKKKIQSLSKELEYYKEKLSIYENKKEPDSGSNTFQKSLVNDIIEMFKNLPDDRSELLQIISNMSEKFGPYGSEQVKILDSCFQTIIENLAKSTDKVMLYCCDKDVPTTKEEYDRYKVMKKFEKHEKYPDPIVRQYIKNHLTFNFSKPQYEHIIKNIQPEVRAVKQEIRAGLKMLSEAKEHICKQLMHYDLVKNTMLPAFITKEQILTILKSTENVDLRLTNEAVFNFEEYEIQVD